MREITGTNESLFGTGLTEAAKRREDTYADFKEIMRQLEEMQESPGEKARRRVEEQKALQAKRDRDRRINELLSLIARLRSKVLSSPDSGAEAALAAAQGELFWLMFSF